MQLSQKETKKNCVSFFQEGFFEKGRIVFEKKWQFLKVKQIEKMCVAGLLVTQHMIWTFVIPIFF